MHHHRRKSGYGSNNSSMSDVRKAVRPFAGRRNNVQNVQKLGKNPREREKEWEEEKWFEEERESFPQFCMTCEKQFVPQDEKFLYCSEVCRNHDQSTTSSGLHAADCISGYYIPSQTSQMVPLGQPRDIIPRASPSRPTSMAVHLPSSPSGAPSSAISALRSLANPPPSPPSPRTWPFTRSAAASPSSSYTKPASGFFSSTFDIAAYHVTSNGYDKMDRPLPSRKPGRYSRPKSIELVTPLVGR